MNDLLALMQSEFADLKQHVSAELHAERVKAEQLATQKASLSHPFGTGDPMPFGGYIPMYGGEMALRVSAFAACIRLISGTVAKLPAHVFKLNGEDRKRDRNHPLDHVMNVKPNPWQTPIEFRRMMTAHVAMHGNGVGLKVKSATGKVEAIIPWNPAQVSVVQNEFGAPPIYRVTMKGQVRDYPASDVFHLRDLTLDGIVGLSRLQQASQGLGLSYAAETYGASYFKNGAEPGIILSTDGSLTPDQRESLRASYLERHGGAQNAHMPLIAEGGLKVTPLAASNKDSQLIELRSFQVEDIARFFGVPPHLIGHTEKQTSWGTGVEQMSLGFLVFHLLDWLVMWEQALKRDCLDETSEKNLFVEHIVEGLLRADLKTRMDAYAIAITNGILSRNEVRKLENREPYEGGDKHLYPSNMLVNGEPRPEAQKPLQFPSDNPKNAWIAKVMKAERALRRVV